MPQGWREHWGGDIAEDAIAALRRDGLVQVLGNLTLVNQRLNPTMSNRPWTAQEAAARGLGDHGKRDYLLQHSQLKLNAQIVAEQENAWTEDDIRARTDALIGRVATIWPRPDIGVQQTGPVTLTTERTPERNAEAADETADEAAYTGKYRQLWQWLQDQGRDEVSLTFTDVEQVLSVPLPHSARRHPTHWYGYEGTALGRAIRDAGWRAGQVNLTDETVTFIRDEAQRAGEDESRQRDTTVTEREESTLEGV